MKTALMSPYYDDSVGTIDAGLLVTRKSIETQPEKVLQLVKAHAQATHYLQTHPEQWLQKASTFGVLKTVLEKASRNIELSWDMDTAFIERAKALGARMQALKVIDKQPDYDRLFDLQFVQKIKAEQRR